MLNLERFFPSRQLRPVQEDDSQLEQLRLLSILSVLIGGLTALLIAAFRVAIEWGHHLLFAADLARMAQMADWQRFCIPLGGALLVGLVGFLTQVDGRFVGIVHVVHQRNQPDLKMPLRNTLMQFIGGSLALGSGSPGGWLGPAVHLGASASTLVDRRSVKSRDSAQTLLAAGVAAAITACMDTPIAGILLASEVILLRYKLTSFVPVMLAAGTSGLLTHVLGFEPLIQFEVIGMTSLSMTEYLLLIPAGILIGLIATGFDFAIEITAGIQLKFILRCLIVGLLLGTAALLWPEVLTTGFELLTWPASAWQAWTLSALIGLLCLKLIFVSLSVGFGMPVGIIGPCLVMGVIFGVIMYFTLQLILPNSTIADITVYMVLGSGAMLAAILNAPLTALVAVLELTGNPHMIIPAMILIAVADLTSTPLYGRKSVFKARLDAISPAYRSSNKES